MVIEQVATWILLDVGLKESQSCITYSETAKAPKFTSLDEFVTWIYGGLDIPALVEFYTGL